MKSESNQRVREHYQQLRGLDCETLWNVHVAAFDSAPPAKRLESVSIIRAVAVVFAAQATAAQKEQARVWTRALLTDPAEKIRRYAIQALPKLGAQDSEETALLQLWERPANAREQRVVTQTLERVGGKKTLERTGSDGPHTAQPAREKLEANIARQTQAGALQPDSRLEDLREVRVLLSCRSGLAGFLREELAEHGTTRAVFHPTAPPDGRHETADHLELSPRKPFALEDLFSIRCWSSLGFPLGGLPALPRAGAPLPLKELARLAGSPLAWKIMRAFTGGPIRYRWEFPARRIHATCARELSERVHALRPGLLNDPRQAPWEMRVAETPRGIFVTLLPKFRPDPRFAYRTGDVPAASHPPLAAAMARFAEVGSAPFRHREHIWDPFCGSGLELAECALRDASAHLWGTDLDPAAHRVAAANIERARTATTHVPHTPVRVFTGDFRDAPKLGIPGDTLTLVITNPPLGKRVPKKDLADLMQSLFSMAQRALVPGGRLVLINPCAPFADKGTLRLQASRRIDLGFAHFPLEKYVQGPTPTSPIFLSRRSEEGRNTPPRKNAAKTPRPQKRFR